MGSLTRLPMELRHEIYRELLLAKNDQALHCQWRAFVFEKANIHPAILRTCKQIHAEASEILYGDNTFIYRYILEYIEPRYAYPKLGLTERGDQLTERTFSKIRHVCTPWILLSKLGHHRLIIFIATSQIRIA